MFKTRQTKYFLILGWGARVIKLRFCMAGIALMDMLAAALCVLTLGTITVRPHNYFGLLDWGDKLLEQLPKAEQCQCANCKAYRRAMATRQAKKEIDQPLRLTQQQVEDKLDQMQAEGKSIEEVTAWLESQGIGVQVVPLGANGQPKTNDGETFH